MTETELWFSLDYNIWLSEVIEYIVCVQVCMCKYVVHMHMHMFQVFLYKGS